MKSPSWRNWGMWRWFISLNFFKLKKLFRLCRLTIGCTKPFGFSLENIEARNPIDVVAGKMMQFVRSEDTVFDILVDLGVIKGGGIGGWRLQSGGFWLNRKAYPFIVFSMDSGAPIAVQQSVNWASWPPKISPTCQRHLIFKMRVFIRGLVFVAEMVCDMGLLGCFTRLLISCSPKFRGLGAIFESFWSRGWEGFLWTIF